MNLPETLNIRGISVRIRFHRFKFGFQLRDIGFFLRNHSVSVGDLRLKAFRAAVKFGKLRVYALYFGFLSLYILAQFHIAYLQKRQFFGKFRTLHTQIFALFLTVSKPFFGKFYLRIEFRSRFFSFGAGLICRSYLSLGLQTLSVGIFSLRTQLLDKRMKTALLRIYLHRFRIEFDLPRSRTLHIISEFFGFGAEFFHFFADLLTLPLQICNLVFKSFYFVFPRNDTHRFLRGTARKRTACIYDLTVERDYTEFISVFFGYHRSGVYIFGNNYPAQQRRNNAAESTVRADYPACKSNKSHAILNAIFPKFVSLDRRYREKSRSSAALLFEKTNAPLCDIFIFNDDILHRSAKSRFYRRRILGFNAYILGDSAVNSAQSALLRSFQNLLYAACKALHIHFEIVQQFFPLLRAFQLIEIFFEILFCSVEVIFSRSIESFKTSEFIFQRFALCVILIKYAFVFLDFMFVFGDSVFNSACSFKKFLKSLFLVNSGFLCGFGSKSQFALPDIKRIYLVSRLICRFSELRAFFLSRFKIRRNFANFSNKLFFGIFKIGYLQFAVFDSFIEFQLSFFGVFNIAHGI